MRPPSLKDNKHKSSPVLAAFQQHLPALKRFIFRIFPNSNDIDDVAQEAFLLAYSAERRKEIVQPKSYLFRIAKHVAISKMRQKSHQVTDYIEDLVQSDIISTNASAEDELSAQQTLGLHCEAVAALSPQVRRVYLMRKVYGMSYKEIAAKLGIAVSTVEKHLIKGLTLCDQYVREKENPSVSEKSEGSLRKQK